MTFTFAARGKIKRTKKTKGRDHGCRVRRRACYSSDSNYALLCLFSEVNFKEGVQIFSSYEVFSVEVLVAPATSFL